VVVALDPRAKTVLDALKERGLSISWAAKRIGESRQSVRNWLTGERAPNDPSVYERLLGAIQGQSGFVGEARAVYGATTTMVRVPVYTVGAAGEWSQADPEGEIALPALFVWPDYRPVLIEGFSMAPHILPGDIAIFREWQVPKVGFVNAVSKDGQLMVKLVSMDDGQIALRSFNPEARGVSPDGVRALGYLVGLYRDDGTESFYRHNRGGLRF
jgi:SOS-response transcriptional repressor LexA